MNRVVPLSLYRGECRPRVGVVVPVYNRSTLLRETLPFVLGQSVAADTLVIADDGSHDGTADAAEQWLRAAQPPFSWRVLRLPHRSVSDARASGFNALGDVDYVAFLDSDDHWPADFLERGVAALEASPGAVAATTDGHYRDRMGLAPEFSDRRPLASDPIGWMLRYGGGIASSSVLRVSAYLAAGGWDHRGDCGEDTSLFCDLACLGAWLHLPGEPVHYQLGNAADRGEQGNLSRRGRHSSFRWARAYESIVERVGREDAASVRSAMARVWRNAGREFENERRFLSARCCYNRSLWWKRVQYAGARRLLKSYLAAPASKAA